MSSIIRQVSDHWREDFRCYASQWGYRCDSQIAKLIDYIRDEFRAEYAVDYRLRRTGKNKFVAVSGDHSDFGIHIMLREAPKFKVTVVGQDGDYFKKVQNKP